MVFVTSRLGPIAVPTIFSSRFRIRRLMLRCLAASALTLAIAYLMAPFVHVWSPLSGMLALGTTMALCAMLGLLQRDSCVELKMHGPALLRMHKVLWWLFWVFLVATYANFFIVEGRAFSTIFADRDLDNLSGRQGSVLGGVVAFLTAVPVALLAVRKMARPTKGLDRTSLLLLVLAIPTLLFSGGRNPLVISTLYYLLFYLLLRSFTSALPGTESWTVRRLIRVGAGVCLLAIVLLYVLYVAAQRREIQDTSFQYSLIMAFDYNLVPTSLYFWLEDIHVDLAISVASFTYYLTHPMVVLSQIFERPVAYTAGFATFPLYTYAVDFLLSTGMLAELESRIVFPGNYTTLLGALYQDGGPVLMLVGITGLLVWCWHAIRRKVYSPASLLLTAFLLLTLVTAPVYAVTSTGFGSSLLFVIVFTVFASSRFSMNARRG